MTLTPDRHPGALLEEEIQLEDRTTDGDPTLSGAIRYVNGSYKFKDGIGVYDPRFAPGFNVGTDIDFLLVNEPPEIGTNYIVNRTSNIISSEEWRRVDTTLLKKIEYTRTGGLLTTETRQIFATDGTTIIGQLTISYTRTGGIVTSSAYVRNI